MVAAWCAGVNVLLAVLCKQLCPLVLRGRVTRAAAPELGVQVWVQQVLCGCGVPLLHADLTHACHILTTTQQYRNIEATKSTDNMTRVAGSVGVCWKGFGAIGQKVHWAVGARVCCGRVVRAGAPKGTEGAVVCCGGCQHWLTSSMPPQHACNGLRKHRRH